jgi:hypothetical protein
MAFQTDIDTRGLKPVSPSTPKLTPPIELQPLKSPFLVASLPPTSSANPDSIRNFNTPGIANYRITPPVPLAAAGSITNTIATIKKLPVLLQPTPAPTIASPLITVPTGFQFSFNQVRLPLSSTLAISSYKVYRGSANNSASAAVIQAIPHHPSGVGVPVVVQDNQVNGVVAFYWVSAVATSGQESTLTAAQTGFVRSAAGFNSNSQLASSFNNNPLNVSFVNTSASVLSNDGSSPHIAVAASTLQFGAGLVSYNSATISSGGFDTFFTYNFDPFFAGGATVYLAANQPLFQAGGDGILPFGKITTVSGSSSTGGGSSAGGSRGVNLT